jgi:hypothetical protein
LAGASDIITVISIENEKQREFILEFAVEYLGLAISKLKDGKIIG